MAAAVFFIRLIEVLFFVGLAGCCIVVAVSWVSIFKSEFFDEEDMKIDHEIVPKQSAAYRFVQTNLESQGYTTRSNAPGDIHSRR